MNFSNSTCNEFHETVTVNYKRREKFVKMAGKFVKLKQREKIRENIWKFRQRQEKLHQNDGKIRQIDHPRGRNCIPTWVIYHPGVGIKFLPWVPITKNRKNTN